MNIILYIIAFLILFLGFLVAPFTSITLLITYFFFENGFSSMYFFVVVIFAFTIDTIIFMFNLIKNNNSKSNISDSDFVKYSALLSIINKN